MAFESEPGFKKFQKPPMLKDFLLSSSSSNGFVSIPRRASTITVGQLLEIDLGAVGGSSGVKMPPRSCSRTSSALRRASETVINAVKHIPFYSIMSLSSSGPKQASSLTRSLSQRLKRRFWKRKKTESTEREIGITVVDVTRWESCEEGDDASKGWLESSNSSCSWLLESDSSSETAAQSSSGSSEYFGGNEGLPRQNDSQQKHGSGVGEDSTDGETKYQEQSIGGRDGLYEDKEQLSPVSVLDRQAYEDGESLSPALPITEENNDQIHRKLRRLRIVPQLGPTNLYKQSFRSKVEEDEEYKKATAKEKDLLNSFRARNEKARKGSVAIDRLMLDFFREGLVESKTSIIPSRKEEESMYKEKLLRVASMWMTRDGGMGLGVEDDKDAYVQGMEDGGRWRSFAVEEEELVFEIEASLLVSLLEELMLDVF